MVLYATALVAPRPTHAKDQPPAPTFTVFATREGLVGHRTANGHRIRPRDRFVALPSWTVLASDGGQEFQVRVSYRGRSVVLPVWDVGPWNTRDEYWQANRRYGDLPLGKPMAHAAYESGYNGGRDEFGRRIQMPNGIDIADGAFWDDLGMTQADWVEVSFLWIGADAAAPPPAPADAGGAPVAIEPNAIAIDDGAAGYSGEAAIKWYDAGCGLGDRHAWTYGTPDPAQSENRARWSVQLPIGGFYEALAFIPACGKPATQSAHYRIQHDGMSQDVQIDQQAGAGSWVTLGTYQVRDQAATIELSDVTGDEGRTVRFDAIKWLPRIDAAAPEARVTEAAKQGDGSLLVRWAGADDVSGIAGFDVQVRILPDGGWSDWQQGATGLEATFVPPGPGSYGFRARATDWLGHQQPWRDGDDVQVQ